VGPYFARLAEDLRRGGATTTKVNFNAGDALFYRGSDVISFRDRMELWPARARELMVERQIDAVFIFGDQRPIHIPAIKIARELGIAVWVFEEGYLRPNYVTVERDGVNGNSTMPRDPDYYRAAVSRLPAMPPVTPVGNTIQAHTLWTALHSVAKTFGWFRYPHYKHHRNVNSFFAAFVYTRGALRKLRYNVTERGVVERVIAENDRKFFVLPLQVYCDAQLGHSDFADMTDMIAEVVATFATAAPADAVLVVKHHPQDVPFRDYRSFLAELAEKHALGDRLVYIHDTHLPTLLEHARGVVTMNSTVGPSALYHDAPVKVLGRAIYDIPGITFQGSLAEFFVDPGTVDHELFEAFCKWLRVCNQVNGSFYRRVDPATASGLPASLFDKSTEGESERASSAPLLELGQDHGTR
jgi:capsule polysaccharide modification protein KpsS